jgi:leucyl-tRNA synthetase
VVQEALEFAVLMLAPIVPHATHVLWQQLGHAGAVADVRWPEPDAAALRQDTIEVVVQVNGKLRSRFTVDADADEDTIKAGALADQRAAAFIQGKPIRKVIVVQKKLVNIVV